MRKALPLIFFLLFLWSCQDIEEVPEPEDLIPPEKMVDVLTEAALLHGARTYNRDLMETKGVTLEKYLWEKYDIDSAQYRRSNVYYGHHYDQYKQIYDSVKLRLERLMVIYDTIRAREERRLDSLRSRATLDTLEMDSIRSGQIRKDSLVDPVIQRSFEE